MLNLPDSYYPPAHETWLSIASKLSEEKKETLVSVLREDEAEVALEDWMFHARREQMPPPGDWFLWIVLAGRGFGKNYAGSNAFIEAHRQGLAKSSAILAATTSDLRKYCLEGPSGILSLAPKSFQPHHVPSRTVLEWPDGSITNLYSSEKPRRVRGGNFDLVWCDELSWWQYPDETWNNLMFACRFGQPRIMVTMTPRPISLVKELVAREDGKNVVITRGSTYDNMANLSEIYIKEVIKPYEGTTLGRQELMGEVLMDVEGALWNHAQLDELRVSSPPELFDRAVVGVDPSASSTGDEAGIISTGKVGNKGYLLGDHTLRGSPAKWGAKAVATYHTLKNISKSCIIVAEKNQGGERVRSVLREFDDTVPIKLVHASVGKVSRAEPVSSLYEQNRILHCGSFPSLEDEMCMFVPGEIKESPNRVDAMVYAFTDLLVKGGSGRAGAWGRRKVAA